MTHRILIDAHDDALKLARDGLYGGRNEVYKYGVHRGSFTMLDINGSYCSVLLDLDVPCKLVGYTTRATVGDLKAWCASGVVVAEVLVESDEAIYPARNGKRLAFPTGVFVTTLAGVELKHAIEHERVLSVRRAAVYEGAKAFRSYAESLWNMRIQTRRIHDVENEAKWKILAASFCGKWGQHGGYWENEGSTTDLSIRHWIDYDYDSKEKREFRQLGGRIQRRNSESESSESSPAIASCITSAARLKLYELIRTCGRDVTYYVDTDSILVSAVGFRRVADRISPDKLGGLKVCWHAESISLWHKKDYEHDRFKVNSSVCQHAYVTNAGDYLQVERVGLQAQIQGGITPGTRTRTVRKTLQRAVDSRSQ